MTPSLSSAGIQTCSLGWKKVQGVSCGSPCTPHSLQRSGFTQPGVHQMGLWGHGDLGSGSIFAKPALASTDTATPQRQAWPPCPPALGAASGLVLVSSSLPTGSLRTAWAPEAG